MWTVITCLSRYLHASGFWLDRFLVISSGEMYYCSTLKNM